MSAYTTKTASLRATLLDTRSINAKKINAEHIYLDGVSIKDVNKPINNAIKLTTNIGSIYARSIEDEGYTISIRTDEKYISYLQITSSTQKSITPILTTLDG